MTINIPIHKNILVHILKDIFIDPRVGPYLGFKGGTSVLLFYNLSRFSVDLDFDLLDVNQETSIFDVVSEILKKYGTVKIQKKRYTLFF